ncbi:TonB-dependent receptor [Puteibacter caeruleilacunae]|nr:TonB-dependent receptor [Puteibacter caeruleilacunae]
MKINCLKTAGRMRMLALLGVFFLGLQMSFAQSFDVKGKITDVSGEVLPGVNVVVKGTTIGTTSDFDGNYTIKIPSENGVITFSFIGFVSKEVTVTAGGTVNVTLEEETIGLDEVVAVGYGVTKKSDLTGSVSSVTSEDFEKQPVFRVEEALQGRAAGVQILKNSGAPGADVKIRIRGANSINGDNSPLVVIDGIIGGDLKSLNTNDIASMEILKDASATAIYGSRGANGVIMVTTKKGSGKAKVDFSYFTSLSRVSDYIDVLSAEEVSTMFDTPIVDGGTHYQKEFFQDGISNNYQLSVSGKEGKTSYFISGNVVDQSGIVINTDYDRYSLRSNLETEINDRLKVGLNLFGSYSKSFNLFSGGSRASTDMRGGVVSVLGWDPTLPVKNADGSYNLQSTYGQTLVNPIAVQKESEYESGQWKLNANLNLNYKITDDLTFTMLAGAMNTNTTNENYRGVPAGTIISDPTGAGSNSTNTVLQNSNILTWNKKFNADHNLKLTGIFEVQKFTKKSMTASGGPYSIPANYYSLSLGTTPSVKATYSESTIQSWIGRGEYNYKNKLFLTATVRADESSRFRSSERLGIFPSASAAYQLDELVENIDFWDRFKLRAGYGETGNQAIAPYSTYSTLATGANFPLDGMSESVGIKLGNNGNPNLTWETTKQSNVGLDFTFLAGRISFSADAYVKNTTDLLLDVPLANYEGGGTIKKNVGEISNKGYEFNVSGTIINKSNLNWTASLNYSKNKNKVESLSDGQTQIISGSFTNVEGGGYNILRVGDPMGQIYGATFLGTYKTGDTDGTPGHAKYLLDDDGNVAFGVIGQGTPTDTWGFNNTITYGKFDLNFLIRGVHGNDILNVSRGLISLGGGSQNSPAYGEYRNHWTPENQTDIPVSGNNIVNSTRYVEDGSFIKLSNLALGYTTNSIKGIKSLRIYVSAQNLFTISDYKGFDPEASSVDSSSDSSASIDMGAFPNPETFTFGINLGF